jgi:hypothetical protein
MLYYPNTAPYRRRKPSVTENMAELRHKETSVYKTFGFVDPARGLLFLSIATKGERCITDISRLIHPCQLHHMVYFFTRENYNGSHSCIKTLYLLLLQTYYTKKMQRLSIYSLHYRTFPISILALLQFLHPIYYYNQNRYHLL